MSLIGPDILVNAFDVSCAQLGEDDEDEEDPFAEVAQRPKTLRILGLTKRLILQIEEDFVEDDLETNLQRDKHARLCNLVNQLIDQLTPTSPDYTLRDVCTQLVCLLNQSCSYSL